MTYQFTPPTVSEGPAGDGVLFNRYRLVRGVSVLKDAAGVWHEDRFFSTEDTLEAQRFYLGGITYTVTADEKADLEAAGYTVVTV